MPELPEVETVRRGLQPAVEGATISAVRQNRPDLRFPFPDRFAERLGGSRVEALERRAKYLLWHLGSGETLISHLGMSGAFRVEAACDTHQPGAFHHPRGKLAAHDHVVFTVDHPEAGVANVVYNDPRRFGFMVLAETAGLHHHPLIAGLGIEPLGNSLDGAALASLLAGRMTSLKAALLDQKLIAGLGNIYVCEALHSAGLDPRRTAGSVVNGDRAASPACDRLAHAIRDVLARAITAGGSTLRDHRQADGTLGYFQHEFSAYGREGEACTTPGCHGTITRIVQNGRSTFLCTACQH